MRGNSVHDVYVRRNVVVGVANNQDDWYHQLFENWDELNLFIKELKEAGIKAWGEPQAICRITQEELDDRPPRD